MADPYTAWGLEQEQIRSGVAQIGINLAALAVLMFGASAGVIFSARRNRGGWKAVAVGVALAFFAGTDLARLIWVRFWVLG